MLLAVKTLTSESWQTYNQRGEAELLHWANASFSVREASQTVIKVAQF